MIFILVARARAHAVPYLSDPSFTRRRGGESQDATHQRALQFVGIFAEANAKRRNRDPWHCAIYIPIAIIVTNDGPLLILPSEKMCVSLIEACDTATPTHYKMKRS